MTRKDNFEERAVNNSKVVYSVQHILAANLNALSTEGNVI
jgi:hypothetical protein